MRGHVQDTFRFLRASKTSTIHQQPKQTVLGAGWQSSAISTQSVKPRLNVRSTQTHVEIRQRSFPLRPSIHQSLQRQTLSSHNQTAITPRPLGLPRRLHHAHRPENLSHFHPFESYKLTSLGLGLTRATFPLRSKVAPWERP